MNPGDFRLMAPEAVDLWRRILSRAVGRPVEPLQRGGQHAAPTEREIDTPEARAFWASK